MGFWTNSRSKFCNNSSLCALQEEEAVQEVEVVQEDEVVQEEEAVQEADQPVIETWTRNIKACTCDCEAADSPTGIPSVVPSVLPTSLPPPSPQGHSLNCMPGEDSWLAPPGLHDLVWLVVPFLLDVGQGSKFWKTWGTLCEGRWHGRAHHPRKDEWDEWALYPVDPPESSSGCDGSHSWWYLAVSFICTQPDLGSVCTITFYCDIFFSHTFTLS